MAATSTFFNIINIIDSYVTCIPFIGTIDIVLRVKSMSMQSANQIILYAVILPKTYSIMIVNSLIYIGVHSTNIIS